jgi:hypothetical protein
MPLTAAAALNAGLVDGLWYSRPTLLSGTTTRVFVAIHNQTAADLTGTVEFSANDSTLGSVPVTALPNRVVEAWLDWTPQAGEYTLTARLNVDSGDDPTGSELTTTLAQDTVTVWPDTDQDGIANRDDSDDDNDTVSDTDETAQGRDPERFDPPLTSSTTTRDVPPPPEVSASPRALSPEPEPAPARRGLERFTPPESRITSVVSDLTLALASAKDTVDTYRAEQPPLENPLVVPAPVPVVSGESLTLSTTSGGTVTRTPTLEPGWTERVVHFVTASVRAVWIAFLSTLSLLLAYPVVTQILLLLLIIYFFYSVARRLGRRPSGVN